MLDINTKRNPDSIIFTVTIKDSVYTFEYQKGDLISKTRDEISSQVKQELVTESIGRNCFFKILNHINLSIGEYLRSGI